MQCMRITAFKSACIFDFFALRVQTQLSTLPTHVSPQCRYMCVYMYICIYILHLQFKPRVQPGSDTHADRCKIIRILQSDKINKQTNMTKRHSGKQWNKKKKIMNQEKKYKKR